METLQTVLPITVWHSIETLVMGSIRLSAWLVTQLVSRDCSLMWYSAGGVWKALEIAVFDVDKSGLDAFMLRDT